MVCELCGKEGSYYFHENAPAYCPHCKQYLGSESFNKLKIRAQKLKKIINRMKNEKTRTIFERN
jgi:superfamily II DNA helicase RecQ